MSRFAGPLLIGVACLMWATDALVRLPATHELDPIFIVLAEHAVGVLFILPWILLRQRDAAFNLTGKDWFTSAVVGIGGSALATVFFTASFLYVNPSISILLQKLQPVLVVLMAALFLGERPAPGFYLWGTVSLAAGIILSFPDLNFNFLSEGLDLHSKGVIYSLTACVLWGISTVAGKSLVERVPTSVATFWRFVFGLLPLIVIQSIGGQTVTWSHVTTPSMIQAIIYMGIVPGILAMLFYYRGLTRTQASVATFAELFYPISAVILNTVFLKTPLTPVQIGAGSVLLFAVTMISIKSEA